MGRTKNSRTGTRKPLTVFLPCSGGNFTGGMVENLKGSGLVESVVLLTTRTGQRIPGCATLRVSSLVSGEAVRAVAAATTTPYALWILHERRIVFGQFALQRFLAVAESTGAGAIYSDYRDSGNGTPLIDYQSGSLRDDFSFGSVLLLDAGHLRRGAKEAGNYRHAGAYAMRLAVSRRAPIIRIAEFLYARGEGSSPAETQFDYVDPRNREVQVEMEEAVTGHLRKIGAYLAPRFATVDLDAGTFPVKASVIIPVRDRARTIGDAVSSVLRQQASFAFNLIAVDNHSTDGTTAILRNFAERDHRIVHLIPERKDLGIGGCWNEALRHPSCGRIAAQLDSDDLYADETTLRRIVEVFYREKCAMVVGSYRLTNMNLEEIPPGVIDHREWTPGNGRNNALRVNGFGAPRAFFTPVLRRITVPDVSYGEDYAVGLALSREYQIGRIYEPIYLCRRWEGNSDANLDTATRNVYDSYKDKIRTFELMARQRMNATRGRKEKGGPRG